MYVNVTIYSIHGSYGIEVRRNFGDNPSEGRFFFLSDNGD